MDFISLNLLTWREKVEEEKSLQERERKIFSITLISIVVVALFKWKCVITLKHENERENERDDNWVEQGERDLLSAISNKRRTLNLIIPMVLNYIHVSIPLSATMLFCECEWKVFAIYFVLLSLLFSLLFFFFLHIHIHLHNLLMWIANVCEMCNGITINHKALLELLLCLQKCISSSKKFQLH